MNDRQKKRSGFTLIELLIVVAIIAILAAIAVPNFLQAQIRAKVAHSRAEMRTMMIAFEAYQVDWNTYPCDGEEPPGTCQSWSWVTAAFHLTTPIAYMTMIPSSPFSESTQVYDTPHNYWFARPTGWGVTGNHPKDVFPRRNVRLFDRPRDIYDYVIMDVAPDLEFEWDKFWIGTPYAGDVLYYDPTNGSVSTGDLYLYGPGNVYNPPSHWTL